MALQPGGYTDNPETDNTATAHPAFNRGKIKGILETLAILRNVIVGLDNGSGSNNNPELEKIRQSIVVMRGTLAHAQDKSTYLSKQCKEALEEAIKIADTLRYQ